MRITVINSKKRNVEALYDFTEAFNVYRRYDVSLKLLITLYLLF